MVDNLKAGVESIATARGKFEEAGELPQEFREAILQIRQQLRAAGLPQELIDTTPGLHPLGQSKADQAAAVVKRWKQEGLTTAAMLERAGMSADEFAFYGQQYRAGIPVEDVVPYPGHVIDWNALTREP